MSTLNQKNAVEMKKALNYRRTWNKKDGTQNKPRNK
jgi:hypothetical protein